MQTNPETQKSKSNRTLLYVLGGCAVIFFLCAICLVATLVLAGPQVQQVFSQVQNGLGSQAASDPRLPAPTTAPNASPIAPSSGPTRTAAPSTGDGNFLTDSLNKAKTAQKFRFEVSWVVGSTKNNKYVEDSLLDMSGELDGKNEHVTMKGASFSAIAGGGALETISADDKSYLKGFALPGFGDKNTWYIVKDTSMTGSFTGFAEADYWKNFGSDKISDYRKVRSEIVDAQPCDVYLYDAKNLQNAGTVGLFGSGADKSAFSALDKAETNIWLCADGFVHKFSYEVQAHNEKNPTDKSGIRFAGHFYDFNNPTIKVTAPAGAKPMPGQ